MTRLLLFGAGGHARELAWLAREAYEPRARVVMVVDDERFLGGAVAGHEVVLLSSVEPREGDAYVLAVGDGALRRRVAPRFDALGIPAATLVHPRVERSSSVAIGAGSVVGAGSVLTTDISLGRHVHVNVGCTISHDAVLGDYATLSPGVHVAGAVRIEEGAFLGIGVSVVNGTSSNPLVIGAGAVVAAGACVTSSVDAGALVAGVPAVRKR